MHTSDLIFSVPNSVMFNAKIARYPKKRCGLAESQIIEIPDYRAEPVANWASDGGIGKSMVCHEGNLSTTHRAMSRGLERLYQSDSSTIYLFRPINLQVTPKAWRFCRHPLFDRQ